MKLKYKATNIKNVVQEFNNSNKADLVVITNNFYKKKTKTKKTIISLKKKNIRYKKILDYFWSAFVGRYIIIYLFGLWLRNAKNLFVKYLSIYMYNT